MTGLLAVQVSRQSPVELASSSTQAEVEFEDLKPKYVLEDASEGPKFAKIEEVPTQYLIETAIRIVTRVGTVDWSELISLVSRELGFARTGLDRTGDRVSLPKENGR